MEFEWDEEKNKANIAKHGLSFQIAADVFAGPCYDILDNRFDYGEERMLTFGMYVGLVVVVAHTERAERIRIISLRRANRHEQALYLKSIA
jgi:uncharacterized protein